MHREHRCKNDAMSGLAATADVKSQFIGGFKGDWEKVPSGQNQETKLHLLAQEGVKFDGNGKLVDKSRFWDDFTLDKL
jgi:methylated-DNA-[protein]-cysteine S-methyltransferase